ncbi:MAG: hypothetical protein AB7F19_06490 [Candidatus Babeliales bacterium]
MNKTRPIIKMGHKFAVQEELIEIDIETDTELIICKSSVWEQTRTDKINNLKNKLFLAGKCGNGMGKPFVIVSKKIIPLEWKNWFNKNNIKYREWQR